MVYFVIWILFIFWYSCTIIFPNCFYNVNDKKIEQTTTIYGNESIHSKEETQEEQQVSEEQTKPKTKIRRP